MRIGLEVSVKLGGCFRHGVCDRAMTKGSSGIPSNDEAHADQSWLCCADVDPLSLSFVGTTTIFGLSSCVFVCEGEVLETFCATTRRCAESR